LQSNGWTTTSKSKKKKRKKRKNHNPMPATTTTTITGIYLEPKCKWVGRQSVPIYNGSWGPVTVEVTDNGGDERFVVGKRYSFSGEYRPTDFIRGTEYIFSGQYASYTPPKGGTVEHQFRFNGFSLPPRERTDGEVLSYLASCPALSIKPAAVRGLFELYGHSAVAKITADPQAVCQALAAHNRRLSVYIETIESAAAYFRARESMQATYEAVTGLLRGQGFPKALIEAVITQWGVAAADRIRHNPFSLMLEFSGAGFAKCDALYTALALPPNKLRRQAYAVWTALADADNGDTWIPAAAAREKIKKQVAGVSKLRPAAAIRLAGRMGLIETHTDESGVQWIADAVKAREEAELADLICEAMDEPNPWAALLNHPQAGARLAELSNHQRTELTGALTAAIAGLTGGPGTGKTFTAAALIKLATDVYPNPGEVVITALAGKAAQRSTESLLPYGVNIRARTTHSLLGVRSFGGKQKPDTFAFNRSNRLPAKIIIVDEFSLDNTSLALAVFRARTQGAAVLLIGDKGQLLPIGHGAPLRDLERAGVPFASLTETHRNAGTIVRVCEKIGKGKRLSTADFDRVDQLDPDATDNPRNLAFLSASTPEETAASVVEALTLIKEKFAADPVWQAQVIVARTDGGDPKNPTPVSRDGLNRIIQAAFNSAGRPLPHSQEKFRVGDKCLQLDNTKLPLAGEGETGGTIGTGETDVANGEFCRIVDANERGTKFTLRFSNLPRDVTADAATSIDLGYAATCHKMQGSQEEWCVYVVDWMFGITREHPFTGVSRCVRGGFVVGDLRTLNGIIAAGSGVEKRKTFLVERIEGARVWGQRAWWLKESEMEGLVSG
jgi:exodeoxyribonuclease V alpha subunit